MGGKTSQSSQTIQIPPEVLARYNAVNKRAEGVANTPFTKYSTNPADFVQQLTGTQQAGISNINANANAASPYYAEASGYGRNAAQAVNPADLGAAEINKYMNPYMQNVLGSTEAMLNQQNQQAMAGQTGNAIRSGAFGGDRAGIAAANLAQQQNLAAGKIYSDIASQGYNQALQTAAQQQGLGYQAGAANRAAQLAASQNMAVLGSGAQQSALQGAQAQLGAGQLEQQTGQAGKTAMYNQFMQEQSYPFQVAQFLANIAEGTGALSGSTTTTQQPGGFFSDERLKEDIHVIGKTFDGQPIYKYRYKGEPKHQIGLIAQDVEKHHPHAVGLAGGYKTVDYDKATEAAEHKGHFASGGLVPESMGGHVTPEHMGEGFASGGSPALDGLSSADLSALLASQAKMFGPFAEAGMDVSGEPHGGLAGYVPQASLPVASLSVPSLNVASPETGLKQAADAAESIGTLGKTYQAGKEAYNKYKAEKAAKGVPMDEEGDDYYKGGLVGYADGGAPEDNSSIFQGAAKAPNEGDAKLDIPNQQAPAPQLQTAQAPNGGRTGMDDLKDIASIGASIAAIAASDKHLKEDIHPVGKTFDGQTVYKYRFKGDPKFQIGLLAQEVEKHHPHAVGLIGGGYKGVNYDKATEAAEHRGHFGSGGMPYGGGLSIPTGDGQQHQLITASAPMLQQQSGLSQLSDIASLAKTGMDIAKGSSKTPSATTPEENKEVNTSGSSKDTFSAAPTHNVDQYGVMSFNKAHGGFADGGMPYSGGLNIPTGGSQPHQLQAAQGSASSGGSGLQQAAQSGLFGVLPALLSKSHGGLAGRHHYADGGADQSFLLGNKTRDEYEKAQEQAKADEAQRNAIIDRSLLFNPESSRPLSVGSSGNLIEHRQLTPQEEDINSALTFNDPTGRFFIGSEGEREYVGKDYSPSEQAGYPVTPQAGLAGARTATPTATRTPIRPKTAGLVAPASAGTSAPIKNVAPVAAPPPIAEAPSDVSQIPTDTPTGATTFGAPTAEPKSIPDQAASTPAAGLAPKTEPVPATGLASKQPVKAKAAAPDQEGHWYTDAKYVIPLLQGIAAMGTTPTRSWGVALSSGLGQGLKGYQQQRQFEIDKAAKQAETKQTEAVTRQVGVDTAAAAAKIPAEAKATYGGIEYVRLADGNLMRSTTYNSLKPSERPPLIGASVIQGSINDPDLYTAKVPKTTQDVEMQPIAPVGYAVPSDKVVGAIEANTIANAPLADQVNTKTADIRQKLSESAATANSQEPQLTALSEAISSLNEGVISGNTFSGFFNNALLNFNTLMKQLGRDDLAIKDNEINQAAILKKVSSAAALAAGSASVEALQTAAESLPNQQMPRDASITVTAGMLIDKQRAIDEAAYERNLYNKLQTKNGYDANEARNLFRQEYSEKYARDKQALISLMKERAQNGQSKLKMLMDLLTSTPPKIDSATFDEVVGVPGISRYFVSGGR